MLTSLRNFSVSVAHTTEDGIIAFVFDDKKQPQDVGAAPPYVGRRSVHCTVSTICAVFYPSQLQPLSKPASRLL